jgi:hypothetical protein
MMWDPQCPQWPVTGIALPSLLTLMKFGTTENGAESYFDYLKTPLALITQKSYDKS